MTFSSRQIKRRLVRLIRRLESCVTLATQLVRTLCSPSPRPSPSGRGGSSARCSNRTTTSVSPTDGRRSSLSPRERAGVRGNGTRDHKLLRTYQNLIAAVQAAFAACLLLAAGSLRAADAPALEELHTAERVRRLTPEQAALHYPVRLRGTITFFDQPQFFRFVQDETAGVYFFLDDSTNNPPLAAGQLVEIVGEANPGEYAPIIVPRHITILGQGTYPPAIPASFEQVASGQTDTQFVEVRGIVRSAHLDEQTKYFFIEIATGGGRLTALARELPVARSEDLADTLVPARRDCICLFYRP